VNYIEPAFQVFEPACHDVIVQSESAHCADHFVRYAHLPSRERRLNRCRGRKWPVDRTGKNGNFGACVKEPFDLLPGDIADAACADLVGKTVKNSDALRI